jgi:cysteine-rich repeat protein
MRIARHLSSAVVALCVTWPITACSLGGSTDEAALSEQPDGGAASGDCTLTQGYWKNHASAWPVSSLTLGSVSYDQDELIAILKTPVKGNGFVQLAHQLIAAKLNVAAGADDSAVHDAIAEADALIGGLVCPPIGDGSLAPSATSELNGQLDAFNSGAVGPGHCGDDHGDEGDDDDCGSSCDGGDTCDQPVCGDGVLEGDEACDDGNTADGDGCSATCTVEQDDCACGDGVLDAGETCDDGNTVDGDGCSSVCTIELPVCGNGIVETGETCDDGNTMNGDGCSSVCICEPCVH